MERPEPGDYVIFTDKFHVDKFGEGEHLVVKCPDHYVDDEFMSSKTWVILESRIRWIDEPVRYKIIKTKGSGDDKSDIDKKLQDQRDANLRSIFG